MIGPQVADDATVNLVLDLAVRIGELELAGGAGAADVTATIIAVTGAYGLHCEADVVFTSITVACHRGVQASPMTTTRVVRYRSLDYTRLAGLDELVTRIVRGNVSASDAYVELDELMSGERVYPRWVATLGFAGMAASVAVLLGGDLPLAGIAALVTAVVDRVGRVLNRRTLPYFFQQMLGALIATAVAAGLDASGLLPKGVSPGYVVGAGLIVLLSGLSLVGTVQDAITGFYVTAAARAFEVLLMSAGLLAGVAIVLQVAGGLGARLTPPEPLPPNLLAVPVQLVAGAATAAFFALASYSPRRALFGAAVGGAASVTTFSVLSSFGANSLGSAGAAAIFVGFTGRIVSRRLRLPPLMMAVAGIVPLLPGLTIYRGLFALAVEGDLMGISYLILAAGIGLALAAGVTLGEFIAQPVRTGLGRLERRLAGPRLMGPLWPTRRPRD